MYSLRNILDKQPVAIASALRSILFVGVLASLIVMDEKLLSAIALTSEIVLSLFVNAASLPKVEAVINEAQAYAQGESDAKDAIAAEVALAPTPYAPASMDGDPI